MKLDFSLIKNNKVLVVGDLLLDRYWSGETNRVSPEAPVPVVLIKEVVEKLGGAGNVASNVSSLGGVSGLIGEIGNDADGKIFEELCKKNVINSRLIRNPFGETIVKHRIVSQGQQLVRADFETENAEIDSLGIKQAFASEIDDYDIVVVSDYGKGVATSVGEVISMAKHLNKKVVVDPKGQDFSNYEAADLVTPNLNEFEAIVGHCKDQEALVLGARELLNQYDLGALLITQGPKGMTLVTEDDIHFLSAKSQEVFDVTGAGDTVCAVIASFWTQEMSLSTACELANTAAGIVVGKLGAAMVSLDEIYFAESSRASVGSTTAPNDVMLAVADARARGEKVVMTNGCFDVLHAGHVKYLNQAKALGDCLLVVVNDDASVTRLKGENRPINDIEARVEMLRALRCVDWVIPFSEDTPKCLISEIKPDVLVKGGDYLAKDVVGAKFVQSYGGVVKILDFIEGYSTTSIVARLSLIQEETLG